MHPFRALGLTVALTALFSCAPDAAPVDPGPLHPALQKELVRLGMLDQTARVAFTADAVSDTALMRTLLSLDSVLTSRLRAIVREQGWPTRTMVGASGARAAFLIVQHSPSNAFQREMLPLLTGAAEKDEASASDAAMLEDRVLTDEGKPQKYGTQFRIVAGELIPYPIEEAGTLDERRARVGLMPMTEYIKLLEETYQGPVRYPADSTSGDTLDRN
jgi:hypothetical protein